MNSIQMEKKSFQELQENMFAEFVLELENFFLTQKIVFSFLSTTVDAIMS
jgi:hypothetical protein